MEPSNLSDDNPSLFYISSPPPPQPEDNTEWSFEENKVFENSLAVLNLDSPDLFQQIASRVPGKTIEQIKIHFGKLVEDIDMIESDRIPLPDYQTSANHQNGAPPVAAGNKSTPKQRRRGVPWTDEEHQLFLNGLEKYCKGDWRSISRHCVVTKTPTQVASHAQKYYLRLEKSATRQNANTTSKPKGFSTSKDDSPMAMAPIQSPYVAGPSSAAPIADQPFATFPF